jgi:glycosyltransferase involved in cell wall biosynthesis
VKVLMMLSTSSVTGPAELCLEDAKALREAGHQVTFACDTRRPGNYADAIAREGFELDRSLTLCPKPRPSEVALDIARLRGRFQRGDFDLVHARFSHDHTLAVLASSGVTNRPKLVRTAEIARSLRRGFLRTQAFRRTDGIVVSCSAYRSQIIHTHGLEPDRVEVIPGRVDAERFSPGDGRGFRSRVGLADDAVVVGIVSRLKPERLHQVLLRAFARVASARPNARLAIIGRGEGEPEVRAEVERLGINARVCFAGYWSGDDLVLAYRGLDVAVWLAEGNDGTCRAVLEAMACGKAVVGGRVGAIAETIVDGETGFLVEPADEDAIAAKLEQLIDDSGLRSKLGEQGRRRARTVYAPERRASSIARFYERVISPAPPRA